MCKKVAAFSPAEANVIQSRVFSLLPVDAPPLKYLEAPGLCVTYDGQKALISAGDKSALARGLFLLALAIQRGKKSLSVRQERIFQDCGLLVDMSRNAVMRVDAVKELIVRMAALGLNHLLLYTEDTYTVPEHPRFGYLRGRYSPQELQELDSYAHSMGIELVPCIQTLAHLGQFLQWDENIHLKDQATSLLIDEEAGYAFIEDELRAARRDFSSRRIHIGMDEAHGIGLGRYYEKHGPVNRFDMLSRHLKRVISLCHTYDFAPMMWSDMFFRLASPTGTYDLSGQYIPQHVIDGIPTDVQQVFWDYYKTDEAYYAKMMAAHQRLQPSFAFAPGIWTWSGFLPQAELTRATLSPGLAQARKIGVNTVLACLWGDDGAETPYLSALSLLPILSEACWQKEPASQQELQDLGEAISGIPKAAFEAFFLFYQGAVDRRDGKGYVYADLLLPLMGPDKQEETLAQRYEEGANQLAPYVHLPLCYFAQLVMDLAADKARAIAAIRSNYQAGNRAALSSIAHIDIPRLIEKTTALQSAHRNLWHRENKPFGWEVLALRYGGISARLADVALRLKEYAQGQCTSLEELEQDILPNKRRDGMQFYQVYVSAVFNL